MTPGLAEEQTIEGLVGRVKELEADNRAIRAYWLKRSGEYEREQYDLQDKLKVAERALQLVTDNMWVSFSSKALQETYNSGQIKDGSGPDIRAVLVCRHALALIRRKQGGEGT